VGNVVAVRAAEFTVTHSEPLLLSLDGDRAPLVRVQSRSGKNLTLVAVHLATDRVDAEHQVDKLMGVLDGEEGLIWGGDFNGDFTSRISLTHGVAHSPPHPCCDQDPEISLDHIYVSRDLRGRTATCSRATRAAVWAMSSSS